MPNTSAASSWSWYATTQKSGNPSNSSHLFYKYGPDGISVVHSETRAFAKSACGRHAGRRNYLGDPPPTWYPPCGLCLLIWRRWVYSGVIREP